MKAYSSLLLRTFLGSRTHQGDGGIIEWFIVIDTFYAKLCDV